MELQGKIIQLLDLQSGQGKNGTWRKQDYILETQGQYPKKVCFNLWGDKIDQFSVAVGDEVTVSFDIESREYNGRWYTDVRAWKIEKAVAGNVGDVPPPMPGEAPSFPENSGESLPGEEDLPF